MLEWSRCHPRAEYTSRSATALLWAYARPASSPGEQVIWKLCLAPDARGHSLGAELLHDAIDALPAGADHVLVEHFDGNDRLGHFYHREGFDVARTEKASSGDTNAAVVWRRRDLDD